jgi:sugar phosphate isomerase/epimerase
MNLRWAYNTNGIANHRLDDALALIAESGYDGVALTLDHHHLDPYAPELHARAEALARRLRELGLGSVIETGARFLLDPRRKHEPTLISPDASGRARRVDFLRRAIEIAAICQSEAVSFWSGVPRSEVTREQAWEYLLQGIAEVASIAQQHGVVAAFEPEPGMLAETVDDYRALQRHVPALRLALDLGHCLVTQERAPHEAVREFAHELGTVTIEDMRRGVHEHLPFGAGDLDVGAAIAALRAIGFKGLVCVELSRDSHRAHTMVPQALRFLKDVEQEGT